MCAYFILVIGSQSERVPSTLKDLEKYVKDLGVPAVTGSESSLHVSYNRSLRRSPGYELAQLVAVSAVVSDALEPGQPTPTVLHGRTGRARASSPLM